MRSNVLLLLLTSCASWPRISTPPIPPPADSAFITSPDGTRLYSSLTGEPRRGIVWFVLGPEIASTPLLPKLTSALHEAGFATAVLHPRGSGFSDGLRGHVDDFSLILTDNQRFLERLQHRNPRVFLLGASAGGAFALELAAQSSPSAIAGLVLVNPAWKLRSTPGMTPTLGDYLTFAANAVFRPSALTVDMNSKPEGVEFEPDRLDGLALQADPFVVRYFSMRYLMQQGAVMDRCGANVERVHAPLLIVQGAHDALVDPAGNDELLSRAATADKTKHVAPQGGHGPSAAETSVDVIVQWLSARAP
ncbi:MAG: alpha/beta hydrolase [Archangiaceae bacterium]|nr:alpha/beta hydrolase [Archangiaceae bacterium]